jgi:hypothetical protein
MLSGCGNTSEGVCAMRIAIASLAALGLALAACGSSGEQRAASGGLTGAGVGALVGGPVGAVAGAAVGGAGGAVLNEGVDTKAERAVNQVQGENTATSGSTSRTGTRTGSSAARPSRDEVRHAQEVLKAQGLYTDRVDGIVGPNTRAALRQFQAREGLQQTARLDSATQQRLAAVGTAGGATTGSGSMSGQGSSATGGSAGTGTSSGSMSNTPGSSTTGTSDTTGGTSNTSTGSPGATGTTK